MFSVVPEGIVPIAFRVSLSAYTSKARSVVKFVPVGFFGAGIDPGEIQPFNPSSADVTVSFTFKVTSVVAGTPNACANPNRFLDFVLRLYSVLDPTTVLNLHSERVSRPCLNANEVAVSGMGIERPFPETRYAARIFPFSSRSSAVIGNASLFSSEMLLFGIEVCD